MMSGSTGNALFVDTSGRFALSLSSERQHTLAQQLYQQAVANRSMSIYTTDHIIAELVALMTVRSIPRPRILSEVDNVLLDNRVLKIYTNVKTLQDAWSLLKQRPDKDWSLADAVSFMRMEQLNILQALTTDDHFEHAGFVHLLK